MESYTLEKLFEVLADNPRGVLSRHDELSGLLGGLNRYRSGGRGNDRDNLLSAWSGAEFKIDRKSLGDAPLRVRHPCLSILGGIQAERLARLGFDEGDGLVERFLFAYPDPRPVPGWCERGINEADASCWADVVRRLWRRALAEKEGRHVPHPLFFTEAARQRWAAHYDAHVAEMNADEFHPALRGCWGKFREYPGRFALVLALMWQADLDELRVVAPVDVDDVDRAWRLAFDALGCAYGTTGLLPGWGRCDA